MVVTLVAATVSLTAGLTAGCNTPSRGQKVAPKPQRAEYASTSSADRAGPNNSARRAARHSTRERDDVYRAHQAFYRALNQNCAGNPEPMTLVWSHRDDVSDFGPDGLMHVGWVAVRDQFARESRMGLKGGVTAEQITLSRGEDWGVTACLEVSHGMMVDGKPADMTFRATNVFRKEDGEWKLVHHHTDLGQPLVGK